MMRQPRVASTFGVIGLVTAALILLAGPASACCTAVICPFAVSSSSQCVGGPNMPVCNVFGCNCNVQCGEFTPLTTGQCKFYPTCSTAAAMADTKARFDEIDTNHDGKISAAEADAWVAKQKDWDKNVNMKGLKGAKTPQDAMKAAFTKADKNHDGSITPAEFDSSLAPAKKK
jgi:EF hand domain-containing protein